jgi:hypothetical protein
MTAQVEDSACIERYQKKCRMYDDVADDVNSELAAPKNNKLFMLRHAARCITDRLDRQPAS